MFYRHKKFDKIIQKTLGSMLVWIGCATCLPCLGTDYRVVLSQETQDKLEAYRIALATGKEQPGARLKARLWGPSSITKRFTHLVKQMTPSRFLNALLETKPPQCFAESAVLGGGRDWNNPELSILGDICVAVPVQVFDNGVWAPKDPNFRVHKAPFAATLLYVPGPLLVKGAQFPGATPDEQELVKQSDFDQEAYNAFIERRILPALVHANADVKKVADRKAVVTIPNLGGGAFAGRFKGRMGQYLNVALRHLFQKHAGVVDSIRIVQFDPSFDPIPEASENFDHLHYRIKSFSANPSQTQLAHPDRFLELGDLKSPETAKLYKIVAWDHVSLPGNDFWGGSRFTDDGVAAAATSSMAALSGVQGTYDSAIGEYRPPAPYRSWHEVADQKHVRLHVGEGYDVVSVRGELSVAKPGKQSKGKSVKGARPSSQR